MLCSLGCTDDLPPREQIVDLRVLGVRLTPPSAVEGEPVIAEALVVNPTGEPVTLSWYVCLEPISVSTDFSESIDRSDCDSGDSEHGTFRGNDETAEFTIPDGFMARVAEKLTEAGYVEEGSETTEALQGLLLVAGWYLQVTLIAESPTARVETQKRMVVTTFPDQNDNPADPTIVIEEVNEGEPAAPLIDSASSAPDGRCLSADSPLSSLTKGAYRVSPVNLANPAPTYAVLDFVGGLQSREETTFFSWFSTVPGLGRPVSQSPDEHPIAFLVDEVLEDQLVEGPDGSPAIPLWIVARDGRGGTAWCQDTVPYIDTP